MSSEYFLNVRDTGKGRVVASCDSDILGEVFSEGQVRLEVSEDFYRGEKVGMDEVLEALEDFLTANLVGKSLVKSLIERGFLEDDEVKSVDGVPHAQLFRI